MQVNEKLDELATNHKSLDEKAKTLG